MSFDIKVECDQVLICGADDPEEWIEVTKIDTNFGNYIVGNESKLDEAISEGIVYLRPSGWSMNILRPSGVQTVFLKGHVWGHPKIEDGAQTSSENITNFHLSSGEVIQTVFGRYLEIEQQNQVDASTPKGNG